MLVFGKSEQNQHLWRLFRDTLSLGHRAVFSAPARGDFSKKSDVL